MAALSAVLAAPALAGNFSFAGSFTLDNDVQFFSFTLLSATTVTLQSLGYGGGTNANSTVIPPGGFETELQIYSAPSGILVPGVPAFVSPGPPNCAPRTPDPNRGGFCQDAYGQALLGPGSYFVALTQLRNDPLGNLSDGFFYIDISNDPNFTADGAHPESHFVGAEDFLGNGNWAVDILFVDSASTGLGQVPEPGSVLLAAAGLALAAMGARRKRRA